MVENCVTETLHFIDIHHFASSVEGASSQVDLDQYIYRQKSWHRIRIESRKTDQVLEVFFARETELAKRSAKPPSCIQVSLSLTEGTGNMNSKMRRIYP
jgi:hypothetical protein